MQMRFIAAAFAAALLVSPLARAEEGCYSVLASDRSGTPYEVRFRGSDLRMVSRYVVKDAPLDVLSRNQ